MKYELVHADTCLPDYWGGHHKAHLQIPICGPMTLKEVKESLKYELSEYTLGCDEFAESLREFEPKAMRKAIAAINRLERSKKDRKKLFSDVEVSGEGYDFVYAFFVFMEI